MSTPKNHGGLWTRSEHRRLVEMLVERRSSREIAEALGRTVSSVSSHIGNHALTRERAPAELRRLDGRTT